jgi:hypothetical protein
MGAEVIFVPSTESPMKFTEKDVRFYHDKKAKRAYNGKQYIPVSATI